MAPTTYGFLTQQTLDSRYSYSIKPCPTSKFSRHHLRPPSDCYVWLSSEEFLPSHERPERHEFERLYIENFTFIFTIMALNQNNRPAVHFEHFPGTRTDSRLSTRHQPQSWTNLKQQKSIKISLRSGYTTAISFPTHHTESYKALLDKPRTTPHHQSSFLRVPNQAHYAKNHPHALISYNIKITRQTWVQPLSATESS